MSKPVPLAYGQVYHLYNRGNNRESIFVEARNYRTFLRLYARQVEPVAETYAYCLLPNHFHFLVRIKDRQGERCVFDGKPDRSDRRVPSQCFSNLFNAYARAFNKAYERSGSLFQRPFGRVHVTSDAYLSHLVLYLHHNPQKHGLIEDFRDWPHSPYQAHLSPKATRLNRDEVLAWFDGAEGFTMAHGQKPDLRLLKPLVPEDFD